MFLWRGRINRSLTFWIFPFHVEKQRNWEQTSTEIFAKMIKIDFRELIKHLADKDKLAKYYGKSKPSISVVKIDLLNNHKEAVRFKPNWVGYTPNSKIVCWLMGNWKWAVSWKLKVYHLVQWFAFWMITGIWESFPQVLCRLYSQLIANVIVWQLQRSVWCYLIAVRTSFCAVS